MDLRKLLERKPITGRPEPVEDADFAERVRADDGTTLVDFWAPWCAPCRLLGGLLEELGPELHGRLRILKLNVDENPVTAATYGVRSIPTMIVFKEGKPVEQIVGAMPLHPLREKLERHMEPVNGGDGGTQA
jgi:thioredoxin 1